MPSDSLAGDDVEILGSGVICAVEGGCDGQSSCDSELDADCSCFGLFSHAINKQYQFIILYQYQVPNAQMFSFLNSFGASSNFQKYRLEITSKNYDCPNQITLRNILQTFCSQDKETKAQIAFATIIKKLLTSESKENWIYILKNLLILDRVIDQDVFIEEISELYVKSVDQFKETEYRYILFDTERIIKLFWKLMKERVNVLKTRQHIFCFKRSQRQDYLNNLTAAQALKQIQSIEQFFAMTFELVDVLSGKKLIDQRPLEGDKIRKARQQFTRSKLLQYIYLQTLHKFMLYYSCQMLCNNYFIQLLSRRDVSTDQIRRYRRHIVKFTQNADQYIKFIDNNKAIKGFQQLNYKELNPFHKEEVLAIIDKLLIEKDKEKPGSELISNIDNRLIGEDIMKVEKKINYHNDEGRQLVPRIKMHKDSNKVIHDPKSEVNPFVSWINAYSSEFPQKEIMTVDLITMLRQQQSSKGDDEQILEDALREANVIYYDFRDSNVTVDYELSIKNEEQKAKPVYFKNIYSSLGTYWNTA